jgi:membrane protein DedA with SNARE-associated domain
MAPDLAIPYLSELSYVAIPIVLLLGSSGFLPIPEEVILLIVGYASFVGVMNLWLVMLVAIASVVLCDVLHFYCATHGHGLLKRLLHSKTMARVRRAVERHGLWAVFIARFVPVMRILTPWVAGTSGMRLKKFLVANALGAVVQTPLVIWIGYALGPQVEQGIAFVHTFEDVVPVVLMIALVLLAVIACLAQRNVRAWCVRCLLSIRRGANGKV